MLKYSIFAFGIMCSFSTFAQVEPLQTMFDRRVQTVHYNQDDVIRVKIKTGVSTLIQLEKDEVLVGPGAEGAGMGMGDPLAWNVSVRGPNIFIRPIAPQPDTNVTLVTNKRTYVFSLETVRTNEAPTWYVRFVYPQPKKREPVKPPMPCSAGIQNWSYEWKGDSGLAPVQAWDDGRFTCIRFSRKTDLPAVYWKWADGKEGLVNSHMDEDVMVVHQISGEFRIRLGDRVAGLRTSTSFHAPFNKQGTTDGLQREVIINE